MKGTKASVMSAKLRLLAWNVYTGNSSETVIRNLKPVLETYRPHAVILMEATKLYGKLGGLGYRVHQLKPVRYRKGNWSETANIVILVRKDVKLRAKRVLRMAHEWLGPVHGHPHDPRVYPFVRIKYKRKVIKLGSAHLPFGQAARKESCVKLRKWAKRTVPKRAVILAGDMNMRLPEFTERIAGPAKMKAAGYKIDLTAYKHVRLIKVKKLGKRGSDHQMMLYTYGW